MLRSCQEVCRKIASDEFAEAGLGERLMMRFHLWRCGDCRCYGEQLRALGASMRQRAREDDSPPSALERLEKSILDAGVGSSRRTDDVEN